MSRWSIAILYLSALAGVSAFSTRPFSTRAWAAPLRTSALLSEDVTNVDGETVASEEVATPTSAAEEEESVSDIPASDLNELFPKAAEGGADEQQQQSPRTKNTWGKRPEEGEERFTAFVGNIPFTISVEEIRELFAEYGDVKYIKMPRNRNNGQTRGFAFVDFSTADELAKAREEANGKELNGRLIRVRDSGEGPSPYEGARNNDDKVYVGNIPVDTSVDELKEFFQAHAGVKEVYIPVNDDGTQRRYAFLTVEDKDKIDDMISATDGTTFREDTLTVNRPLPRGVKSPRPVQNTRSKIYCGNLDFSTTSETLLEMFSEIGPVHDVFIPTDSETGESRGFAFVSMDEENVDKAVAEFDGVSVDGRYIRVNRSRARGEKPVAKTKIYCGNLDYYTEQDQLFEVFSEFGRVHDVYIPLDPEYQESRGFAFVTMDAPDAAQAIAELNGMELDGRMVSVRESNNRRKQPQQQEEENDDEF